MVNVVEEFVRVLDLVAPTAISKLRLHEEIAELIRRVSGPLIAGDGLIDRRGESGLAAEGERELVVAAT